jgi:hypothetical protein
VTPLARERHPSPGTVAPAAQSPPAATSCDTHGPLVG